MFNEILRYFLSNISKNISYKELTKPWIAGEIKRKMRIIRDSFFMLYREGRIGRQQYCTQWNKVKRLIREGEKQYFNWKFQPLKGDIKRTWSLINDTIKPNLRKKRGYIDKIHEDGNIVDDPNMIANCINK